MNSTDDMNRVRWLRLTPRQRETITAQIEATCAAMLAAIGVLPRYTKGGRK